jgi:hypothetical protein
MIHHLVIARWGLVIQRPLEAATRTFPLLVVLFVPVLLGMHELYSWTHAEAAHDHVLMKKAAWLNETAFYIRAVIYFALWLGLSYALSHWSQRQDQRPEEAVKLQLRMRKLSGIGLVVFGLAVTFAAFDWIMSIEPKWFSTIFGSLVMVSQGISALCLMAIVVHRLRGVAPIDRLATTQQFHDIGNFMFAFTILWTYMSASQYIIIWSANLPEEIEYYLHRAHGGWPEFAGAIAVLLFAIPFLVMLFKANKKALRRAGWHCGLLAAAAADGSAVDGDPGLPASRPRALAGCGGFGGADRGVAGGLPAPVGCAPAGAAKRSPLPAHAGPP